MKIKTKFGLLAVGIMLVNLAAYGTLFITQLGIFGDRISSWLSIEKLKGDQSYFLQAIEKEYGVIDLKDGTLVDSSGVSLEGRYDLVDKIAESIGDSATIFVTDGNDFRRVVTNIVDSQGKRAVGTKLGVSSSAYETVSKGNTYIGAATILGKSYVTQYTPIKNTLGQVIGLAFIGVSNSRVQAEVSSQIANMILVLIGMALAITVLLTFVTIKILSSTIIAPLMKISSSLEDGAKQITAASTQLSSVAQGIANGANEQATAVEETSASMEELSSMVKQNLVNTREANLFATSTSAASRDGFSEMTKMVESMRDIAKSSVQINKIVKVIDDISFQTNILSLNAAVEAARAGEVGLGFAVVADEVKNLANRSENAAKESTRMIEDAVRKIQDGAVIADRLAESFKGILSSAEKLTVISKEVETASSQQEVGINQVTKAVIQFDTVVQANAATSEEAASSAEELSSQAAGLMRIVDELSMLVLGKKTTSETISVEVQET